MAIAEQQKFMMHKLRGLLQALSNFVDCMDDCIANSNGSNAATKSAETKEYCSIVVVSLREIEKLVKEIEDVAN